MTEALIIGGYSGSSGQILTDLELLTRDRSCLADMPSIPPTMAVYAAMAELIEDTIVLCGGTNPQGTKVDLSDYLFIPVH